MNRSGRNERPDSVMNRLAGSVSTAATRAAARSMPARAKDVVVGRVAADVEELADGGDPFRIGVDDHDVHPGLGQVTRRRPPDSAPAAHDDVPVETGDLLGHASPLHRVAELPFDEQLQRHGEGVQSGAHPGEDDHHREHLPRSVQRLDLAEAHRGDGRHRLVDGVEHPEAEHHVADRSEDHHPGECGEPQHEVTGAPHRPVMVGIRGSGRRATCQPASSSPAPSMLAGRPRRCSRRWVVAVAAETTGSPVCASTTGIAGSDGICTQAETTTASARAPVELFGELDEPRADPGGRPGGCR